MKLSDIKYKFGKGTEPKDGKMIELLKSAYNGDLLCRVALIKIEGIKTFSDFIPKISAAYVRRFGEYVIEKSEPFKLPTPSIEVIKDYES